MKNYLLILLPVLIMMSNCTTDDEPGSRKMEQVHFSFQTIANENAGGRVNGDLPPGLALLITITDQDGNAVLTHKKVDLLYLGTEYITAPIELLVGTYVITDFMLVNSQSEVLFATPLDNSPLGPLVHHSLPHTFSVRKNKLTTVAMEVVDAAGLTTEHFGYSSFDIKLIRPIAIAVFVNENGALKLTSATAEITTEGEFYTHALDAKTNFIGFQGNPTTLYTLKITSPGFGVWMRKFTYQELLTELQGEALKIILRPKEIIQIYIPDDYVHLAIAFNPLGVMTIAWGDGEEEVVDMSGFDPEDYFPFVSRGHLYSSDGNLITISGDIESITNIYIVD